MRNILLASCLFYWILTGMTQRRHGTYPLLFGFLAGMAVAFFCFCFLPDAFCDEGFFLSILATGVGIFCGVWMERFSIRHIAEGAGFTGAALFYFFTQDIPVNSFAVILLTAWLGGYCLYMACGVILPEDAEKRESFFAALGGCIGFLVGTFFRFMG